MVDPTRRARTRWRAKLGLPVLLMATVGCGGGQDATPEAVRSAKQLWERAGIRDYDLDWSVTGTNNAHYFVTVRGGEVRKVEMVGRDGGKSPSNSHETSFFSVDGLFHTIDEELAVCSKSEMPFGQPKGTKIVMRFQPDGKLGYPHWYRRDVLGSSASMAIDVIALIPVPASPKSPGG
jgi:Family of unknown function (DUF6174)